MGDVSSHPKTFSTQYSVSVEHVSRYESKVFCDCHIPFFVLQKDPGSLHVSAISLLIEKLSHTADGWRRMTCELQSLQNFTYGSSYARNIKGLLHPYVVPKLVRFSFFHGTYGLTFCYFWSSTTSILISFCASQNIVIQVCNQACRDY